MKSVQRIILALIMVVALLALAACTNSTASTANMVAPKTLSQEQQDIVDLLTSNKNEILFFEFKTQKSYKRIDFWVETYEYGVLVDRPSGANQSGDEAEPLDGQVAVIISRDKELQFAFTLENDSTRTSHTSTATEIDDTLARGSSVLDVPVAIENGKEIVLYSAVYSSGSLRAQYEQEYAAQPGLLAEYPLAHLIKCKFES